MEARPAVPLYGYQREWVLDRSRWKIGMFARQTGKTFTTTLEIVDSCFAAEAAGGSERWVILSRGERQAAEAMREGVRRHARAYGLAAQELEYEWRGDGGETFRALECELPGGSRITALPANPDTARGFSANVFLDEFAFHRDSREIWGALFPVVSAGHRLRVTSTPNGTGNKFYELMTGGGDWSRHECDIHRAVADGLPRDVDGLRAALGDEDLWEQEFEIKWRDGASAWLGWELINAAEHPDAGDPGRGGRGPTVIGNDIGRRRDLWVAWVAESVGDVLWTREVSTLRGATFAAQDAELARLAERWRPHRIAMDQTGMGEKPVEDAKRRHGARVVEGVVFAPTRRLDLATELRARFEDRRIRIPAGDLALRADLRGVKRVAGPTGAPRLVVEAEEGADGHSDRFWAAALAAGAAASGPVAYGYRPVGAAAAGAGRGRFLNRPDHSGDRPGRAAFLGGLGRLGRRRGAF